MNQADAPVRVGDVLAGKYRVERVLGAGAMGVVVAARHVELGELWAIKFMLPAALGNAEGVERFLREARAAARLRSRHVAKVHDVGRLPNGAPYLVMEHLSGADMKQILEQRGALSMPEAAMYLLQACEAIAEAHAAGIVHRDLKPANLFLTTEVNGAPCVKVLDFGIAKVPAGAGGPGADMTATSALLGTPLYMSPEQMRGARDVDARADIWALGVILYRMLAGRTPFSGSSVTEICAAVVADTPAPLGSLRGDLPPAIDALVMRCLDKNPAGRFASVAELSAALMPFTQAAPSYSMGGPPAAAPPAAPGGFTQGPGNASYAGAPAAPGGFGQGPGNASYAGQVTGVSGAVPPTVMAYPRVQPAFAPDPMAAGGLSAPRSSKVPLVLGGVLALAGLGGGVAAAVVILSSSGGSGGEARGSASGTSGAQAPALTYDPRSASSATGASTASAPSPGSPPKSTQPGSAGGNAKPTSPSSPGQAASSPPPSAAPGSLALGASCQSGGDCASGFCVDRVCCGTSCTGKCMACTPQKKFSGGEAGICGFISGGEDPDHECGAGKKCNGDGGCVALTPTQVKNLTGHD